MLGECWSVRCGTVRACFFMPPARERPKQVMSKNFNILMYSHDTYGLGHIRRTMAIANQLKESGTNILILTGSPIVGRFTIPKNIDFVRIPGMIKITNEEYLPLSIKINPNHALAIREKIIIATAKAFQPSLLIVDKEPLGLKKEVLQDRSRTAGHHGRSGRGAPGLDQERHIPPPGTALR